MIINKVDFWGSLGLQERREKTNRECGLLLLGQVSGGDL